MPVPVWDCSDLSMLDEPLDTATVVSEDIWKKFDLDFPLDNYCHYERTFDDGVIPPELAYEKMICQEIRHHDCMWAGLCISKEHNRTLPAKKDPQIHKKVPAGRSLLISRANPAQTNSTNGNVHHQQTTMQHQQQQQQQHCRSKNLDSDGDSTRPDTPQTSSSDTETEDEAPVFRHDQINIHERLSECMSAVKAVPVSEVTGQLVRRMPDRRKFEETHCYSAKETTDVSSTLSDHCYHINQPNGKRLEHLGVQTPSDSEEEIDVVSFEKPSRPAAVLPTYPSPAEQQHFQLTVNTAFRERPAPPAAAASTPTPRPRGRPPIKATKKNVTDDVEEKPARRTRQRPYERKAAGRTPRVAAANRSSSDDEAETEKRSLHNNMERQRRIELRNAFEELRMLVPEIEMKDKAPKVAILRQAAKYCDILSETEQRIMNTMEELKRRQERLRARLRSLRKCLAQTR